jgi:hypothetical protein
MIIIREISTRVQQITSVDTDTGVLGEAASAWRGRGKLRWLTSPSIQAGRRPTIPDQSGQVRYVAQYCTRMRLQNI